MKPKCLKSQRVVRRSAGRAVVHPAKLPALVLLVLLGRFFAPRKLSYSRGPAPEPFEVVRVVWILDLQLKLIRTLVQLTRGKPTHAVHTVETCWSQFRQRCNHRASGQTARPP